jgi:hypothetical protein
MQHTGASVLLASLGRLRLSPLLLAAHKRSRTGEGHEFETPEDIGASLKLWDVALLFDNDGGGCETSSSLLKAAYMRGDEGEVKGAGCRDNDAPRKRNRVLQTRWGASGIGSWHARNAALCSRPASHVQHVHRIAVRVHVHCTAAVTAVVQAAAGRHGRSRGHQNLNLLHV